MVSEADGSGARLIAPVEDTNHPLPSAGERWRGRPTAGASRSSRRRPGPEHADANGDPMVITRYLYKPTASEGLTRFNDNRRLHIFVVDVAHAARCAQLTDGRPLRALDRLVAGGRRDRCSSSNREADPDQIFNYDIFAVSVGDGAIRRLTATRAAPSTSRSGRPTARRIAYLGTKREPHVVGDDDGGHARVGDERRRHEPARDRRRRSTTGRARRSGRPTARRVYFTVQERGHVAALARAAGRRRRPSVLVARRGSVGSWSADRSGRDRLRVHHAGRAGRALMLTSRRRRAGRAHRRSTPTLLAGKTIARRRVVHVQERRRPRRRGVPHACRSGDGDVEASADRDDSRRPARRSRGRRSTPRRRCTPPRLGVADGELSRLHRLRPEVRRRDLRRPERRARRRTCSPASTRRSAHTRGSTPTRLGIEGGSYGGQLTDWIITQTHRFKAAIPSAGISNLVSFNYMSYYHDYLAVEFGSVSRTRGELMDMLWERSRAPLREPGEDADAVHPRRERQRRADRRGRAVLHRAAGRGRGRR